MLVLHDEGRRRDVCCPHGAEDAGWLAARPLVELVVAAMEPITPAMAAELLEWDGETTERVLERTALLFPVRDGRLTVFHKTVVDWLTGDESASIAECSAEYRF